MNVRNEMAPVKANTTWMAPLLCHDCERLTNQRPEAIEPPLWYDELYRGCTVSKAGTLFTSRVHAVRSLLQAVTDLDDCLPS